MSTRSSKPARFANWQGRFDQSAMLDSVSHSEPKRSSERSFGVVFCVVFLLIGCWPLMQAASPRWFFIAAGLILLAIGFLRPSWLKKPNYYWYKFGIMLGAIVAPIVMSLVFLITIVPIGLIAKLLGKDMLDQRLDPTASSYWKNRTEPMQAFDKQY